MTNKNQNRAKFNMALYRYLYKPNDGLNKDEKMKDYSSIMGVLKGLKMRGYSNYFYLFTNIIECKKLQLQLYPEDFEVKEVYRFKGGSNPDDNPVLYVIESKEGIKGVLVDALGTYAESHYLEVSAKLYRAIGLKNRGDGDHYGVK